MARRRRTAILFTTSALLLCATILFTSEAIVPASSGRYRRKKRFSGEKNKFTPFSTEFRKTRRLERIIRKYEEQYAAERRRYDEESLEGGEKAEEDWFPRRRLSTVFEDEHPLFAKPLATVGSHALQSFLRVDPLTGDLTRVAQRRERIVERQATRWVEDMGALVEEEQRFLAEVRSALYGRGEAREASSSSNTEGEKSHSDDDAWEVLPEIIAETDVGVKSTVKNSSTQSVVKKDSSEMGEPTTTTTTDLEEVSVGKAASEWKSRKLTLARLGKGYFEHRAERAKFVALFENGERRLAVWKRRLAQGDALLRHRRRLADFGDGFADETTSRGGGLDAETAFRRLSAPEQAAKRKLWSQRAWGPEGDVLVLGTRLNHLDEISEAENHQGRGLAEFYAARRTGATRRDDHGGSTGSSAKGQEVGLRKEASASFAKNARKQPRRMRGSNRKNISGEKIGGEKMSTSRDSFSLRAKDELRRGGSHLRESSFSGLGKENDGPETESSFAGEGEELTRKKEKAGEIFVAAAKNDLESPPKDGGKKRLRRRRRSLWAKHLPVKYYSDKDAYIGRIDGVVVPHKFKSNGVCTHGEPCDEHRKFPDVKNSVAGRRRPDKGSPQGWVTALPNAKAEWDFVGPWGTSYLAFGDVDRSAENYVYYKNLKVLLHATTKNLV